MEGFFMGENIDKTVQTLPRMGQGEQLLTAYDLEVENITKGRGSLLIHTAQGLYMFKMFTGSKEKTKELAQVLAILQEWDNQTETLVATKEGDFWVKEDGGPMYILKRYTPGRECDVKNVFEVLEGVRKLADLHLALREMPVEYCAAFCAPEHGLEQEVSRHNRELRNLKNYIRKKKKKTPFEELYEQMYGTFYQQALQMEDQIAAHSLLLQEDRQLCHGDYHHHNVLDCSGRSHVQHFENMRLDSPLCDLAKYIRKVLEKNRWNAELGNEMIRTYTRVIPLREEQWMQLYWRLAYPEKFWKIANHYNNNKKAWASKRDGDKLRQIIAQENSRQEFLGLLYNLAR